MVTASIRRLLQLSPPPLSLTRFSPGLFVVLQEILYQPSFALIRLLPKKNNAFLKQNNFFLSTYSWPVLVFLLFVYVSLWVLFHSSAIMKLGIASYICTYALLPIWPLIRTFSITKEFRIHDHGYMLLLFMACLHAV